MCVFSVGKLYLFLFFTFTKFMKTILYQAGKALLALAVFTLPVSSVKAQQADATTRERGATIQGGLAAIQAITPKGELPGQKIPYYVRTDNGERYLVGGLVVNMTARAADTGDLYEWAVITGGKGAQLPRHSHAQTHVALMVLDGAMELWLAGKHYYMIKGDFASVPPGTTYAYRMVAHHSQVVSMSSGNQMGVLYRTLGKPYAGYVQPADAVAALAPAALKQAEQVTDVRFDSQPLVDGNSERVVNAILPKSVVPYVLAAGEGDRYTIADQLFGILCDNATTNGKLLVVTTEGPAGQMIGKHYHQKHSESFFCIDGQVRMVLNQSLVDISPGDFAAVPAGTIHAYQFTKPYTRIVGLLTPGVFENFFRSCNPYLQHVYPQIPIGAPDFSKIAEMDIVLLERPGPPPAQTVPKN